MSDNLQFTIGIFLGIAIPAVIMYAALSGDRPNYYEHQIQVACLNGGGIWENDHCSRPDMMKEE